MSSPTVAALEASAQKAKDVLRRRNARVHRAKKLEQAAQDQAVLALLATVGLLSVDLPTLRDLLTPIAAAFSTTSGKTPTAED